MLINTFKSLFHPEYFHGWGKKKRFFEGFYFKLVDFKKENCVVIISGGAIAQSGITKIFFQIFDDKNLLSDNVSFDGIFQFNDALEFKIDIHGNLISKEKIELNLPNTAGRINFSETISWSKKWYSPGAMGPFTFLPKLECYHGILSMQSKIDGSLIHNGRNIDFTNGTAYIEKDWGHSFPKEYIWLQCNHFKTSNTSLSVSIAKTKYFGKTFRGFLVGFYFQDSLIEFTTYNFSKVKQLMVSDSIVHLIFENKNLTLELTTNRIPGAKLKAPINGKMIGEVTESLNGKIDVKLLNKRTNLPLFQETGSFVGLEVEWKIEK